jgi:hypothetical protein
MKRIAVCFVLGLLLVPTVSFGAIDDDGKQIVVVQGQVDVPPPPTIVVGVEASPPPPVVVTPVPAPQPVYVQAQAQPQPVYVQAQAQPQPVPQPVYYVEPPEPEGSQYGFAITVNPMVFWFGAVGFEGTLLDWFTLYAQVDFLYLSVLDWAVWGVGVFGGPNFYPGSRAPQGFFVGPRVGYDHFGWTEAGDSAIEIIRAGLALGYQWVWSGFDFAIGGGGAWNQVVASDGSDSGFLFNMFIPFFDLRLGFAL